MLNLQDLGVVLAPGRHDFESKAVSNPACVKVGDTTHMFYRAVGQNDHSTIGYCQIKDGKVAKRLDKPLLVPEHPYEQFGLEDPRITKLGDTFYLFYTAYDGKNARVAYAATKELPHFAKRGLVTPRISYDDAIELMTLLNLSLKYKYFEQRYQSDWGQNILLWEKDCFLFPEKFNGRYGLVHRILPGIQIVYFDSFSDLTIDFWKDYLSQLDNYTLLEPKYWYESRNIGGGCPPLRTDAGWLLIYHAVEDSRRGHIYHAGAALLDLNDPTKTICRLPDPLFSPNTTWEESGVVSDVVFPTGLTLDQDALTIYYGAADRVIGRKSVSLSELLFELLRHKETVVLQPANT